MVKPVQRASHVTPELAEHLSSGLLEAMPGGVVYIRADGTVGAANQAALSLLGMSHDILSDRIVADFEPETIHEDGSPCKAEDYPVSQALATGEPTPPMTIGVRRRDGELIWAIFEAVPVRNVGNEVEGAIVTFLDITARKRAEEEAERSRELLYRAQSLAKFGCFEWVVESNRVMWTDGMFEIYGTAREDFGGDLEATFARVHPDDRQIVARLAEGGTAALPTEYRIVRPDGTVRHVWGIAETVEGEDGQPRLIRGAIQDITERKELENNLRQIQRMESIGQLAGGIAHDFNNLLQVILANAALGAKDNPGLVELAQIEQAAVRAAELTKQLLEFGRRRDFNPKALDPNQLLGAVEQMLVRTLAGQVVLDVARTPDIGSVSADSNRIEQVLMNLCINARDAMPSGGTIRLSLRMVRNDAAFRAERPWAKAATYVEISVADNGVGMDDTLKAKIFEPFFTTKAVGDGTGLGLAAAYGILLQHDGMMEVDSVLGVGSTFRVYLPAVPCDHDREALPPQAATRPGSGATVMIVEDDARVRDAALRALQGAGYPVIAVAGGQAALDRLASDAPPVSVVVTDVVMPMMDGNELGAVLADRHPHLEVLYTTGYATAEVIASVPSDRLLTKPYPPAVLVDHVAGIVAGSRRRAPASGL